MKRYTIDGVTHTFVGLIDGVEQWRSYPEGCPMDPHGAATYFVRPRVDAARFCRACGTREVGEPSARYGTPAKGLCWPCSDALEGVPQ